MQWRGITRGAALCALLLPVVACASTDEPGAIPAPDQQVFVAQVWPLLVRDCGFSTCHGDPSRFFRVLGPGHERLDPGMRLADPVTPAELQLSYERARSMIDPDDPASSPLLRKPLEVAAGGSLHEGTDSFGRDVYRDEADTGYQILYNWVVMTGAL